MGDPDDLSATRSGPSRPASTSPCAHLQLNRLPSISHTHTQKEVVCELGEVERKLHRRWLLCFFNSQQFTHLLGLLSVFTWRFYEREDVRLCFIRATHIYLMKLRLRYLYHTGLFTWWASH